jgi:putative autotransporter adhesin-like protein
MKEMKRFMFCIPILLLCAGVFAQSISDANAESRNVKEFHSIKVMHGIDIYLAEGDKESIAVSAKDRKFVSQIKTEVKDGILNIWHDGGDIHHANPYRMGLKVYISFVQLNDLELGPGCHAYAEGEWKDADLKKRLLKSMK